MNTYTEIDNVNHKAITSALPPDSDEPSDPEDTTEHELKSDFLLNEYSRGLWSN